MLRYIFLVLVITLIGCGDDKIVEEITSAAVSVGDGKTKLDKSVNSNIEIDPREYVFNKPYKLEMKEKTVSVPRCRSVLQIPEGVSSLVFTISDEKFRSENGLPVYERVEMQGSGSGSGFGLVELQFQQKTPVIESFVDGQPVYKKDDNNEVVYIEKESSSEYYCYNTNESKNYKILVSGVSIDGSIFKKIGANINFTNSADLDRGVKNKIFVANNNPEVMSEQQNLVMNSINDEQAVVVAPAIMGFRTINQISDNKICFDEQDVVKPGERVIALLAFNSEGAVQWKGLTSATSASCYSVPAFSEGYVPTNIVIEGFDGTAITSKGIPDNDVNFDFLFGGAAGAFVQKKIINNESESNLTAAHELFHVISGKGHLSDFLTFMKGIQFTGENAGVTITPTQGVSGYSGDLMLGGDAVITSSTSLPDWFWFDIKQGL